MQWDLQNKGKSGWTGVSSFVLEVPLRNLRPSVIYSVPCDRIVQRAYSAQKPDKTSVSTGPSTDFTVYSTPKSCK